MNSQLPSIYPQNTCHKVFSKKVTQFFFLHDFVQIGKIRHFSLQMSVLVNEKQVDQKELNPTVTNKTGTKQVDSINHKV